MSKSALPFFGVGGLGAASMGGYMFLKGERMQPIQTQQEVTFKSRYAKAILEEGSALWNTKFEALKGGSEPIHSVLKEAKSKASKEGEEAKNLHKKGCLEIYASNLKEISYLEDFKTYCARNIKDQVGNSKTWISGGEDNGSPWNAQLTKLKDHSKTNNSPLDKTLGDLKNSLTGESTSWDKDKRKVLKDWCDASQKEIFEGDTNFRFVHVGLYCFSN
ncbi:hypothetical protein HF1_08490 [Mycoplasma haemofelis str. Langford 1]|uniref:Uncharacterized protein n=2 Tax=Mycoplasma haemofelis TaxID=29501 RepID=F6FIY8_MYCHI|nr:hypothetical protein [Mycoplasma haemofelis]AEG73186.1 hypothetical protein MHF_0929 [Mycoplasma haemofelis Ohio2]CBY92857.1 hypothetical protein HF1_08490 [Mycoplasma haemofelis str. Langford 1]